MIDEQGRLFGVVNVVDLAVLLVVGCIVVAGVALVFSSDSSSPEANAATSTAVEETRYVTLDIGTLSPEIAEAIEVTDTSTTGGHTLNITDIAVYEHGSDEYVVARAALVGEQDESGFEYAGAPPRLSRPVAVTTPEYNVSGRIRTVESTGEHLDTRETPVVLSLTASESTVESIAVGDTYEVAGQEVARIEHVEVDGLTGPGTAYAHVGISYQTLREETGPRFGYQRVETGTELPFYTDEYGFEAPVSSVGTTNPPGTLSNRTVTFELSGVDESAAQRLEPGMTETVAGETIVEITDVQTEPSQMVLTTDGDVVVRDHPTDRDIRITANIRTRQTGDGLHFKGEPLYEGETVLIDLGQTTISPTVADL